MRVSRVLLDVNVLLAGFNRAADARVERESAQQLLASVVCRGRISSSLGGPDYPVQLITSYPILETFKQVLSSKKMGLAPDRVQMLVDTVHDAALYGPIGGIADGPSRKWLGHLRLKDSEDASVLETAVRSRADVLVTNNLRDFSHKDFTLVTTVEDRRAFHYDLGGGVNIVIAHPIDVVQWIRAGYPLFAETLWPQISKDSRKSDQISDTDFSELVAHGRYEANKQRREQRRTEKNTDEQPEPQETERNSVSVPYPSPRSGPKR